MRKFVLFASLVGALVALSIGVGSAGAAPGNGNGAVVQRDAYGNIFTTCFVSDGGSSFWQIDNCTFDIVTTPSGNVNETVKGTVDASTPPPSSAFKGSTATTGQGCDPGSGAAIIDTETITPSDNFTAKCSTS